MVDTISDVLDESINLVSILDQCLQSICREIG